MTFRIFRILPLLTVVAVLALSGSAAATPTIFWSNYSNNTIAGASLAGGGSDLFSDGQVNGPFGTSADPATGRVFWANYSSGQIYSGNLNNTSETPTLITADGVNSPYGLTYNPANDTLYWVNDGGDDIRYIKADGSTSTSSVLYDPTILTGGELRDPVGGAVDPAAGKIYWANYSDGTVGYANLDGSGSAGVITLTDCSMSSAYSVSVDAEAGKLYVTGSASSAEGVFVANIDGSNCQASDLATTVYGATASGGTLFAANYGAGSIPSWPLASFPAGNTNLDTTGASTSGANYPAIIDTPTGVATASPASASPGATLTCTVAWSYGTPGMQLYRAPESATSFAWFKDGQPIAGAESATVTASDAGSYTCQTTATNYAGTSSETSNAVTVSSTPAPPSNDKFKLTVEKTDGGTVTSNPQGIDCGTICSADFDKGAKVTLLAQASSGYKFTGFSGVCSGTSPCVVEMSEARSVKANFAKLTPPQLVLQVKASKSSVRAGQRLPVTINVENIGEETATDTGVCLTIPRGFAFSSATKPYTIKDRIVCWGVGDLIGGQITPQEMKSVTVNLRALKSAKGSVNLRAAAAAGNAESGGEVVATSKTKVKIKKAKRKPKPVTG